MNAIGTISLEMKRLGRNQYFGIDFYVCPPQADRAYEIILGQEFLNRYDVLTVNKTALLPLLVDNPKLTPGKHAAVGQNGSIYD
jgi:hypothetical protein